MASAPIPVRLTPVQIVRLQKVGERLGVGRSQVIKMCLLAFLQRFERDGLAMLPTDWEDQLKNLDGRTHRYAAEPEVLKAADAAAPVNEQRIKDLRYAKAKRPKKPGSKK